MTAEALPIYAWSIYHSDGHGRMAWSIVLANSRESAKRRFTEKRPERLIVETHRCRGMVE